MKNIPFLKRFIFCLPVLICSTFLYADDEKIIIPKSLNIQGMVTNDTGKPVTKKDASLEVRIGDAGSGITIPDKKINIDNGLYNEEIDVSSALEVLKLSDKTLSVTIKDIGSGSKKDITSTGKLWSTPYSIYSSTSNYAFMLDPAGTKLIDENFNSSHEYKIKVSSAAVMSESITDKKDYVWGVKDDGGVLKQTWIDVGQAVTPEHAKKLVEPDSSLQDKDLMWLYKGKDGSKTQNWTEISKVEIGTATVAKELLTYDNGGTRLVNKNFITVTENSGHKYDIRVGTATYLDTTNKLQNDNFTRSGNSVTYDITVGTAAWSTDAVRAGKITTNGSSKQVWGMKDSSNQGWIDAATAIVPKEAENAQYVSTATVTENKDSNNSQKLWSYYGTDAKNQAWISTGAITVGKADKITNDPSGSGTDTDKIWSYKSGSGGGQDWHFIVPANFGAVNYSNQYKIKVDSSVWATDAAQAGKITSNGTKEKQVWGMKDSSHQGWIDAATAIVPKEAEKAKNAIAVSTDNVISGHKQLWYYNGAQNWTDVSSIEVGTATWARDLRADSKLSDSNFENRTYNIKVSSAEGILSLAPASDKLPSVWAYKTDNKQGWIDLKELDVKEANKAKEAENALKVSSTSVGTDGKDKLWYFKYADRNYDNKNNGQNWTDINSIRVGTASYLTTENKLVDGNFTESNAATKHTYNIIVGTATYLSTTGTKLANGNFDTSKVYSATTTWSTNAVQAGKITTNGSSNQVWGMKDSSNQGWIDAATAIVPKKAETADNAIKVSSTNVGTDGKNKIWYYDDSKKNTNGGQSWMDADNIKVGTATYLTTDHKLVDNNFNNSHEYNIWVTSAARMRSTPADTTKQSVWTYKTDNSQNWEYLDSIKVSSAVYIYDNNAASVNSMKIWGYEKAGASFKQTWISTSTIHVATATYLTNNHQLTNEHFNLSNAASQGTKYEITVGTATYLSTSGAKLVDGNFDTISDNPSNPVIYDIKVASSVITERYEIYQSTQVVVEFDAANSVNSSSVGKVAVINSSGKVEVCSTNADTKIIGIISEVDSNKVKVVISGVVEGISCSSTDFDIGNLLQATNLGEVKVNSSAQIGTVIGKAISTRNGSGKIKVLVNLQ